MLVSSRRAGATLNGNSSRAPWHVAVNDFGRRTCVGLRWIVPGCDALWCPVPFVQHPSSLKGRGERRARERTSARAMLARSLSGLRRPTLIVQLVTLRSKPATRPLVRCGTVCLHLENPNAPQFAPDARPPARRAPRWCAGRDCSDGRCGRLPSFRVHRRWVDGGVRDADRGGQLQRAGGAVCRIARVEPHRGPPGHVRYGLGDHRAHPLGYDLQRGELARAPRGVAPEGGGGQDDRGTACRVVRHGRPTQAIAFFDHPARSQ